jgi:hypothetical protein
VGQDLRPASCQAVVHASWPPTSRIASLSSWLNAARAWVPLTNLSGSHGFERASGWLLVFPIMFDNWLLSGPARSLFRLPFDRVCQYVYLDIDVFTHTHTQYPSLCDGFKLRVLTLSPPAQISQYIACCHTYVWSKSGCLSPVVVVWCVMSVVLFVLLSCYYVTLWY